LVFAIEPLISTNISLKKVRNSHRKMIVQFLYEYMHGKNQFVHSKP
jgi:hypothetical protein